MWSLLLQFTLQFNTLRGETLFGATANLKGHKCQSSQCDAWVKLWLWLLHLYNKTQLA
jgi:hypothetical protein